MKQILIIAIVAWGLLAPISYHPDTKLTLVYPALNNGKVWDIYTYLNQHKLDIPYFHYPPAHYWWLKVHYSISKVIGGNGFDSWLKSNSGEAQLTVQAFKYNLSAKLPLLILGLFSGWLIYRIVKKEGSEETAKRAAFWWYLNPITLYSVVLMGQNDIVAILCFLLGINFYNRKILPILFFILAAAIKNYPLIWTVIFISAYEKKLINAVLKIGAVVSGFGLILLPWLNKSYFIKAVLDSGLSQRMFVANLPIGFDKEILIIPMAVVVIFFIGMGLKQKNVSTASWWVAVMSLLVLGFSHFNPQWMLWSVPFLLISGRQMNRWWYLSIFFTWLGLIIGFNDSYLYWGIFSPINNNLLNFPTIVDMARNRNVDLRMFINLCQSVIAGAAIYAAFKQPEEMNNSKKEFLGRGWIIVVWIIIIGIGVVVANIKTLKLNEPLLSNIEKPVIDSSGKEWTYKLPEKTKYALISLDNQGMKSEDEVKISFSDNKVELSKEISGYNSTDKGWVRVDLNGFDEMLKLHVVKTTFRDGYLKYFEDSEGRWAMKFYNFEDFDRKEFFKKISLIWWWWGILAGLTFWYLKEK